MGLFNFGKKVKEVKSFHTNSKSIGIYRISGIDSVNLIELEINEEINGFEPGEITQEIKGKERLNWQTAYDEKYLDDKGTEIIGDDFNRPRNLDKFRVIFFFHYLDLSQALISQYGLIKLTQIEDIPERLKRLIEYEQVD